MNLTDVFTSPFKLSASRTFVDPIPSLRVSLKTKNMHGKTTKEEIFILCKMYFDNYVNMYKNYTIEGMQTTESSYSLTVGVLEDDELRHKHIYSISYDNIGDRIAWENKYDENFSIVGTFFVALDISTYVIPDYDPDDMEDDNPKPILKAITEKECVVCFENKPNILYTECLHIVSCSSCDTKGKFSKCPLCRTKIKNKKIRI